MLAHQLSVSPQAISGRRFFLVCDGRSMVNWKREAQETVVPVTDDLLQPCDESTHEFMTFVEGNNPGLM
jgi:hypothetical protein